MNIDREDDPMISTEFFMDDLPIDEEEIGDCITLRNIDRVHDFGSTLPGGVNEGSPIELAIYTIFVEPDITDTSEFSIGWNIILRQYP